MKFNLTEEELDGIKKIQEKVEEHSRIIDDIVYDIIQPYCEGLDNYVAFIKDCLKDGENPPTDEELEDMCLNLSTRIYFMSEACEQLGIKDDLSKAIRNEVYNKKRDDIKGTIADKDSYAELESQQEQITNICYSRAYRIVKAKVDNAQELLQSCKKVLSRRMVSLELSKVQR